MFLSVAAFLLSVSAIVVGAEALRRINGQNEEFLKAYVKQIRKDLIDKDEQMVAIRRELQAIRKGRQESYETLRRLEQQSLQQRGQGGADANSDPFRDQRTFIPSSVLPKANVG